MAEEVADHSGVGIKNYMINDKGNKEIETSQQRILMILKSLGIPLKVVDISAPGSEEERDYMRSNGKKKEGARNVLPPQVFNGDKYCGDYDDFDIANEDDKLEEFLGVPRKGTHLEDPKATAVEGDANKLEGQPAVNGESEPMEKDIELEEAPKEE